MGGGARKAKACLFSAKAPSTTRLMASQRGASALRNAWNNDIENIVMSVKKQMFVLQKCALDLTMSFRKYDLTRPGCDPNVKSGMLDATEFERALAAQGIF